MNNTEAAVHKLLLKQETLWIQELPLWLQYILDTLKGVDVWIAGGAVRDLHRVRRPNDIDIFTKYHSKVIELLRRNDFKRLREQSYGPNDQLTTKLVRLRSMGWSNLEKVDVIEMSTDQTIEDIILGFDFTCNSAALSTAWSGEVLLTSHHTFKEDVALGRLIELRGKAYEHRIARMKELGFDFP